MGIAGSRRGRIAPGVTEVDLGGQRGEDVRPAVRRGRCGYRSRMVIERSDVLAAAFVADGPADGVDLSLFGQFAGSWELDCTEHDSDGSTAVRRGEWHFGYALGGLATTDVWILPGVEHGVSVRFPDPAAGPGSWRSTWVGPGRRRTHTFAASRVSEQIVLDGGDLPGAHHGHQDRGLPGPLPEVRPARVVRARAGVLAGARPEVSGVVSPSRSTVNRPVCSRVAGRSPRRP